jgi:NAD-dependent dihydropyrimidine dehydrogenase PreA subunit
MTVVNDGCCGWGRAGIKLLEIKGSKRGGTPMTYVITEPCIGTKDQSCVEVCPVDCIYDAGDHFMINPEECIDCGACEPECPVEAIYPEDEVPEDMESYTTKAANYFE